MAMIANHRAPAWALRRDACVLDQPTFDCAVMSLLGAGILNALAYLFVGAESFVAVLVVAAALVAGYAAVFATWFTWVPGNIESQVTALLLVRKQARREQHTTLVRLIDEQIVALREAAAAHTSAWSLAESSRFAVGEAAWSAVTGDDGTGTVLEAAARVAGLLPAGADGTHVVRAHRAVVAAAGALDAARQEATVVVAQAQAAVDDGRRLRATARVESSDRLAAVESAIAALQGGDGRAVQATTYRHKLRQLAT